jgi:hypothetical protein
MNAFQARIDEVVGDFLETALVVDDEALRVMRPVPPPDDAEEATPPPARPRGRQSFILEDPEEGAVEVVADHPLRTKQLIDAFADRGIVCGAIAPHKDDDTHARVLRAACRTDLLILDWDINRDGGRTARGIIKALREQDAGADRRRLRVIAIYTGQPDLVRIMRVVAKDLELSPESVQDGGLTLSKDGLRIVGLCKPIAENLPHDIAARQVDEV